LVVNNDDERKDVQDRRLAQLLAQWPGLPPAAGFEAAVWRRIRAGEVREVSAGRRVLEWLTYRPVAASAWAAAAGVLVGVGLALTWPARPPAYPSGSPLLSAHSVAGAYMAMVTGGVR